MRVKSEGRASPVDRDLLTAAMARLATVPDAGAIEIVIAGDLEASVKKRLPAEEASLYSVRRISGAVGAKTLPRDDGCSIIVDSRLLSSLPRSGEGDRRRRSGHCDLDPLLSRY